MFGCMDEVEGMIGVVVMVEVVVVVLAVVVEEGEQEAFGSVPIVVV